MRNSFTTRSSLCLLVLFALILPANSASREPVRAQNGMVASTSTPASQAGVEIMRRGGNAVDAAVATAFALAVTYPNAGNLGGGGFMMIRLQGGKTLALDYRETAPRAAGTTLYLDKNGELIEGEGSSTIGYRASGIPGTVAGMEAAWKRYGSGKISWAQLIEPARKLAQDGFVVSHKTANTLRDARDLLNRYEDSRRIFLRDGNFFQEGEVLRQPQLAATLKRLQQRGAREFYEGETARLIAADMKRNNGLITLDDLKNYIVKERESVHGTYRGYQIVTMPPPSSGGVVLIQMLNMMENYDLLGPTFSGTYHGQIEAMRRAFADRAEFMADPDFVCVPVSQLISKSYAKRRFESFDLNRASSSREIGAGKIIGAESMETTHFTVVDKDGNAVSNTYTLNGNFGSGAVAHGTGVLLNNEMDDFTTKPGAPNLFGLIQGEKNAIEPGKRPLSSMTPTFVLRPDGSFWFAVGSPGGPTIINTVFQIIVNVIDHDMSLQQAIDAPRIHHQWLPDEVMHEPYGLSLDTRRALEMKGHRFANTPRTMGDAQGVMVEQGTGVLLGASDPRGEGTPIGY